MEFLIFARSFLFAPYKSLNRFCIHLQGIRIANRHCLVIREFNWNIHFVERYQYVQSCFNQYANSVNLDTCFKAGVFLCMRCSNQINLIIHCLSMVSNANLVNLCTNDSNGEFVTFDWLEQKERHTIRVQCSSGKW